MAATAIFVFFRLNSGLPINYFVKKRTSELNISAPENSVQKPLFSVGTGFRFSVLVSQGCHIFTDVRLRTPERLAKVLALWLLQFSGKKRPDGRTF